jgi:NAD(P)-dependent dehydrogenase (short-subunit alcohol dehydrogenase family)
MGRVLITGCSTGFGRATAVELTKRGHEVLATARRPETLDDLDVSEKLRLDVDDDRSVAEAVSNAGRVDALVNNAGFGITGPVEHVPLQEFRRMFETNVLGAVRMTQAVLPQMRERGSGSIVNVSSVTGRVAAIGQSPYFTSKFALEGFSEGLAQEVAPFGIRVVIVEPGVTKSAIFAKNVDAPNSSGVYDTHYRRMFQFYAAGIAQASDPFEVAAVVHHAITTPDPQLRYPVSWGGRELTEGRARIEDTEWVALGAVADDAAYYRRFGELFGVDIAPAAP